MTAEGPFLARCYRPAMKPTQTLVRANEVVGPGGVSYGGYDGGSVLVYLVQ